MFAALHKGVAKGVTSLQKGAAKAVAVVQASVGTQLVGDVITIGDHSVRTIRLLGEGGFAYVYEVEDTTTGERFALKKMLGQDAESTDQAKREIKFMTQFREHPNIVAFHGSTMRTSTQNARVLEFFVLLELCPGGTLIDVMAARQNRPFSEKRLCSMFMQIVSAVAHLHSFNPPVAHRDLKMENVLLSADGTLKLCDFGSCTTRARAYKTRTEIAEEEERIQKTTTSMYRAPEMADLYKRQVINEKADVWALGCILFTMAYAEHPFQDCGNLGIISGRWCVPATAPKYSVYVTALLKRLFCINPKKRPSSANVLALMEQWQGFLMTGVRPPPTPSPTSHGDGDNDDDDDDDDEDDDEAAARRQRRADKKAARKLERAAAKASKAQRKQKKDCVGDGGGGGGGDSLASDEWVADWDAFDTTGSSTAGSTSISTSTKTMVIAPASGSDDDDDDGNQSDCSTSSSSSDSDSNDNAAPVPRRLGPPPKSSTRTRGAVGKSSPSSGSSGKKNKKEKKEKKSKHKKHKHQPLKTSAAKDTSITQVDDAFSSLAFDAPTAGTVAFSPQQLQQQAILPPYAVANVAPTVSTGFGNGDVSWADFGALAVPPPQRQQQLQQQQHQHLQQQQQQQQQPPSFFPSDWDDQFSAIGAAVVATGSGGEAHDGDGDTDNDGNPFGPSPPGSVPFDLVDQGSSSSHNNSHQGSALASPASGSGGSGGVPSPSAAEAAMMMFRH